MKKNLFLLFALVASTTLSQAAIVDGTCGYNLTWSLNTQDSILNIKGYGDMNDYYYKDAPWSAYTQYIAYVNLPDGLTKIGHDAFEECSNLTSITIPESVTKIAEDAFRDCTCLTAISIPNSIKAVDMCAFSGCHGLKSAIIGTGLTSITKSLFYDCRSLKSIELPQNIKFIDNNAFAKCSSLKSITIPDTIYTIGSTAFLNCTNLTSVTFGERVSQIKNEAFSGCTRLASITCKTTTPPTLGNDVFKNVSRSIPVYVPFESVETYRNTILWEEFTNIRAIGSVLVVKFVDWNGTVLSSVNVEEGASATPPANPYREGYTFIGWDKDFSNVTEDMIITAQYKINRYKVDFVDWDETVLKSDSVVWNTAATAPENPYRKSYTFIGWDKDFSKVTQDLIINAQYEMGEKTDFNVQFKDKEEAAILSQSTTLMVPAAPVIEGFTFIGWQIVSTMLDSKLIEIQAVYEADEPSSAQEIVTNPSNPAQKLIHNGSVYILTDDSRTYTLTGQEVR